MSAAIDKAIQNADDYLSTMMKKSDFDGSYLAPVSGILHAMRLMAKEMSEMRRSLDEFERQAKQKGWNMVRISPGSPSPGNGSNRSPPSWN